MSSGGLVFLAWPGDFLAVEGAGLQASVEDADEAVGDLAEGGIVLDLGGALLVVKGTGAGRGGQGSEGLGHESVGETVIADEAGDDDFLLSGRASERGRSGVVLASLAAGVTVRVVTELAQDPGTESKAQPGLGQVDLSVRVTAKNRLHLTLHHLDLLIQGDDHRDQRPV